MQIPLDYPTFTSNLPPGKYLLQATIIHDRLEWDNNLPDMSNSLINSSKIKSIKPLGKAHFHCYKKHISKLACSIQSTVA